jgi:MFS family permease
LPNADRAARAGAGRATYDRAMAATLNRALDALRSRDFRSLLAARLVSTAGDGLFQAALVTSIIFSPEEQGTVAGFAVASLVIVLPFSILGPFAGVFIDRWPRRRILLIAPLARAALAWLVLVEPSRSAPAFYAAALWVLSLNRFYLATATAVVPRLVPAEDLLMANSLATLGGTTALLAGVFVGGLAADAVDTTLPLVLAATAAWVLASLAARHIASDLLPHIGPASPELLRHAVRRVSVEFVDGIRHLAHAPRALAPIASMSLDQLGQGLVLVLSLFVFRERFREGAGSFSWLIGAGGAGVFLGLVTVGKLEERHPKGRIIAGAFALSGFVLVAVSTRITPWSVLLASFAVGLTFAWKKIPSDTLVQEAVPDGYRGRVFAVYDVVYQVSRLVAAALAVPLLPAVGAEWSVAITGLVFLAWTPVVPRWIAGTRGPEIRFYEGARAEEWPRSIVRGGVEEGVEVVRSWREERDGVRLACFRLALQDGTVLDVSKPEGEQRWRIDRELEA